ncbi:hypothetical protein BS50DRAFT_616872 [Corynespora cassiicola Philippines]|uniref:Uncharacterized protein n=1 Tax=Corynespora cassiicola Philippines TaxID=1448308 RepID=A0A2T2P778_CORCC|nr:hypothetical protein BS50DRAFT_616872 [Corynespora cassiicola Philippines]
MESDQPHWHPDQRPSQSDHGSATYYYPEPDNWDNQMSEGMASQPYFGQARLEPVEQPQVFTQEIPSPRPLPCTCSSERSSGLRQKGRGALWAAGELLPEFKPLKNASARAGSSRTEVAVPAGPTEPAPVPAIPAGPAVPHRAASSAVAPEAPSATPSLAHAAAPLTAAPHSSPAPCLPPVAPGTRPASLAAKGTATHSPSTSTGALRTKIVNFPLLSNNGSDDPASPPTTSTGALPTNILNFPLLGYDNSDDPANPPVPVELDHEGSEPVSMDWEPDFVPPRPHPSHAADSLPTLSQPPSQHGLPSTSFFATYPKPTSRLPDVRPVPSIDPILLQPTPPQPSASLSIREWATNQSNAPQATRPEGYGDLNTPDILALFGAGTVELYEQNTTKKAAANSSSSAAAATCDAPSSSQSELEETLESLLAKFQVRKHPRTNTQSGGASPGTTPPKRGRGRPRGSRNKPKDTQGQIVAQCNGGNGSSQGNTTGRGCRGSRGSRGGRGGRGARGGGGDNSGQQPFDQGGTWIFLPHLVPVQGMAAPAQNNMSNGGGGSRGGGYNGGGRSGRKRFRAQSEDPISSNTRPEWSRAQSVPLGHNPQARGIRAQSAEPRVRGAQWGGSLAQIAEDGVSSPQNGKARRQKKPSQRFTPPAPPIPTMSTTPTTVTAGATKTAPIVVSSDNEEEFDLSAHNVDTDDDGDSNGDDSGATNH